MLWFFVSLIILPVFSLVYAGWKGQKLPELNPSNYFPDPNDEREVVVCCGDSITHGRIGYDWVSGLAKTNKNKIFINAGINGDLSWNLHKRLGEIIKCQPSIITILIGTNDAMGSQSKKLGDDYIKMKKLPQHPSIDWYKKNYDMILTKLINKTNAKIYLITLPWIGENENSKILEIVKNHNKVIEELAIKYKLEIIPFFENIKTMINKKKDNGLISKSKYEITYKRMIRIIRAIVLHYLFRVSWNNVSNRYQLKTLCDFIHLNDNGGLIISDLIQTKLDKK